MTGPATACTSSYVPISDRLATLERELNCPIEFVPLTLAVCLIPCAHKIQQTAAERLFGRQIDGWKVTLCAPCPLCKVNILVYMVDHSTRNIAKEFLGKKEDDPNALLPIIIQKFETPNADKEKPSLEIETTSIEAPSAESTDMSRIPYPGRSAKFVHFAGNWERFINRNSLLCQELSFKSDSNSSLIQKFSVLGYEDGIIRMSVQFYEMSTALEDYFNLNDLGFDCGHKLARYYQSNNLFQLKTLFKIISENNEIPEPYLTQIKGILFKEEIRVF